ncbi:MAG: dTDP-4-amino-4,6-dideoxygalactose transaminase [Bacteroidetes bacterium]|nr:dTDP-4-amino-4,6-dideoxygalactose transaminase [Bacteroidota bacterium]
MIPFNKPYLSGKETEYIRQAVESGKISGDGIFTRKCHTFFEKRYGFGKCLLTTSCTDALEMAALLIGIEPGDEVIAPSYTFVSTVNAFVLRGAKVIFIDSCSGNPNMDAEQIEQAITPKTKAIIPVHYAGIACDMDTIMSLAKKHKLFVVEDCAQAVDSFYKGKALGTFGDFAAFSFHETKNIISGEGGMIVINNSEFVQRAEIIREKGTNRSAFFRGEVDKYGWVDVGSSFLPSDIIGAFLFAQLENIDDIQEKRKKIWNWYYQNLSLLEQKKLVKLPQIPSYATNNGHMFYLTCKNLDQRTALIQFLRENNIYAVFHYLSLHKSPYYSSLYSGSQLTYADRFTDCLVRFPLYYELKEEQIVFISETIKKFFL